MKLMIGENIRSYRKKNGLTQEEFAERLGVTYQSVSRWENGATYPDLELIPSISELLGITVDGLLGMPMRERERRASEAFDALRRECMKRNYDTKRISELLREIRRDHIDSEAAVRLWCEGNMRAFGDPEVLPEVRLLAEAYLERHPMCAQTIRTMAVVEDEAHLSDFLEKYTTAFDCSERALMFERCLLRGDAAGFERERIYQLHEALCAILDMRSLVGMSGDASKNRAAVLFAERALELFRCDAAGDGADIWVFDRIETGLGTAEYLAASGECCEAVERIGAAVRLIEDTMHITERVILPTSCRFLDGMERWAEERWASIDNDPDGLQQRMIYVSSEVGGVTFCACLFPSVYHEMLTGASFAPLRGIAAYGELCERVRALIEYRTPTGV